MEKVIVEIGFSGKNFSAHLPNLPGCVATGHTPHEIKEHIIEAVDFHIKGSKEDNDPIPECFLTGNFELVYKFDAQSLLRYYKSLFKQSGMERITGINKGLLSHYATGAKKPRPAQRAKIQQSLRDLGQELMNIEL